MRNIPNVYSSWMPGAPKLSGTPGSWVEIMKKCLVAGFDPVTVSSITVLNGLATITSPAEDKNYFVGCQLNISGCTEPLLNKNVSITKNAFNSFCFVTTVADGTYGGTIKVKLLAAGWETMFTGTNVACFRSLNLDGMGVVAKVTDTNAKFATFDFYENMTTISAGTNRLNIATVQNNTTMTLKFFKAYNADAVEQHWWLIADNSTVYFCCDPVYVNDLLLSKQIDAFIGALVHGFGMIGSNDPILKKNFAVLWPYYDSYDYPYSAISFRPGMFINNTLSYTSNSAILFDESPVTESRWLRLVVNYYGMPIQSNRISGTLNEFNIFFNDRVDGLVAKPTYFFSSPLNTASSVLLGTSNDHRYYCNQTVSVLKNFSSSKLFGKTYINLPHSVNTSGRAITTITTSSLGIMPFLVNETWD